MNGIIEKVRTGLTEHKAVVIRIGGVILGALVGVVVGSMLVSSDESEIFDQNQDDFEQETETEDSE